VTKRARKKEDRPSTVQRPVLQFRVHPDTYEAVNASAEKLKLTISEEAARRLERFAEYDAAFGSAKKLIADTQSTLARSVEAQLRTSGYTPIASPKGTVWLDPGMDPMSVSVWTSPEGQLQSLESALEKIVERAIARALASKSEHPK
jgi:hypothetical protein